jgi:CHAT domain-containing protein
MEDEVRFLVESIQLISNIQASTEQVSAFWQINVDKINASLIQIIPDIVLQILEANVREKRPSIARTIGEFSDLMHYFPFGNRGINLEVAITGYQTCASIITQNEYPSLWATTQYNLGLAYHERIEGARKINIELAIQVYQTVLEVYTRQDFPVEWASTQNNLATFYRDRIEGKREENIELAIDACYAALEVRTQQDLPFQWATTQYNLGVAYYERIEGERKENIELAVKFYQAALEVCTKQDFSIQWASIQYNLGIAYLDRIECDRKMNIELAIQAFRAALEVYTPQKFPFMWARSQNYLGTAYYNRIEENHLELAIEALKASLEVFTRQQFPLEWATTQNSLGNAYYERIEGERKVNLELAIQSYQTALEVYTRQDFPFEWGTTQNCLGNAYLDRIQGERRTNIELAIQTYQAALEVYTYQNFPVEWAHIQNCLGGAYHDRIEGDRQENIELAIQGYWAALEVYSRQDFPVEWAMAQINLGNVYRDRIKGNRRDNIELSINFCKATLEVYTRQEFSVLWAFVQDSLGKAYYKRVEGNLKENIELAIQSFQSALKVYTRQDFPDCWANIQRNLGATYLYRIKGDRKENIELAIQAFQSALEIYTRQNFPEDWAMTQNNLGNAYHDRIEGERKGNIELAIQSYQAALEVRTRHNFPVEWAMIQNNLGFAFSNRIEGDRKENIELAIQAFRAVLEVTRPGLLPLYCLHVGHNLGNVAFKKGDWHIAIEGFEKAIAAVETSRSWAMSDRRRQEILNESIGIYEKMLQSCINADRLDLALQTVERVRSKRLVDLMATPDLYLQGEIPEPVRLILERIADTQKQMDDLRTISPANAPEMLSMGTRVRAALASSIPEIHALEAQKQALLYELNRYDAVSAQLVEVNPPNVSQIQAELLDRPDIALLSFYTTIQDTHILIVQSDSIQCFTCSGQGSELRSWLINEWILTYIVDRHSWQNNMPELIQQIAERLELDRLVSEHLQDTHELILIPHLFLHLIPFAALPLKENKQYLGDRFLLRYAPCCEVLKLCTDREELPSQQQYGTVENTMEDLPFAAIEGEAIAQIFKIEDTFRLRGSQQSTIDAYKQLLNQVNSVALCHHAQSRLDNPLESALLLGNGRRVTLADLLSPAWRFANLSDVFLSCCETGMTMPKSSTDELLTLGTGFLCAGARSVISSLWTVSDIATALLSQRYHQYRAQGQDRIVALQKSQQDLRSMSGEQLKIISESEFIPALIVQQEQLEQRRQDARRQQQQAEGKRYGELIDRLVETQINLENLWTVSLPFDHPVYWAAFTCQGLR